MKHLFVPYEIALALKEKGFDEPCLALYTHQGNMHWVKTHGDYNYLKNYRETIIDYPSEFENWNGMSTNEDAHVHLCTAFNESDDDSFTIACSSPLYQQVIDWFREKHGIVIETTYASTIEQEEGFKYHLRMNANYNSKIGRVFPYYEALNKAIEEALKL